MIESSYLLPVVAGLIVVGNLLVGGGVFLCVRGSRRDASADAAAEVTGLRQELQAISVAMASFSELLDRFYDTSERGRHTANAPAMEDDTDSKALEVAARLAGTGVGVEEIVSLCGVSEGEARLIRALNEEQDKSVAVS